MYPDLAFNVERMELEFLGCSDIMYRNCSIDGTNRATLIYVDGMCDTHAVDEFVLQPLLEHFRRSTKVNEGREAELKEVFIPTLQIRIVYDTKEVIQAVLRGETVIFTEGNAFAMVASLIKMEKRSIEEATSEKVVRGPRDAFMETLRTNTSLLRRRIRSSKLKLESMTLGSITETDVVIGYMEGIVKESLIKEVRARLQKSKLTGSFIPAISKNTLRITCSRLFPRFRIPSGPMWRSPACWKARLLLLRTTRRLCSSFQ